MFQMSRELKVLAFLLLLVTVASATEVLPLDRSNQGAGKFTPRTMPKYLHTLNDFFNGLSSNTNFKQVRTTHDGTAKVYQGRIAQDAPSPTFYWQAEFTGLNQNQVHYIQSLFNDDKFSSELTPSTDKPETRREYHVRNLTQKLLGDNAANASSQLIAWEIKTLPAFSPALDREMIFLNVNVTLNETCTIYAAPSVSIDWIEHTLEEPSIAHDIHSRLNRPILRNHYPSGQRVCIWPRDATTIAVPTLTYAVQVIHLFTTPVGGLLLEPLASTGCFDNAAAQEQYLTEAQLLETNVQARAF